jgi:hypothetical protein
LDHLEQFARSRGWSLTDRSRAENERHVAAEVDEISNGRDVVWRVHKSFLPDGQTVQGATPRRCTSIM